MHRFIEEWGTYRENIPMAHSFKWDGPHLRRIAAFAVAFPAFIYHFAKAEVDTSDAEYEREKREFV